MSGDLGDYEKKEVVCGKARAKNMLSVLAFEIFEVCVSGLHYIISYPTQMVVSLSK